jgi:hypothetical protein
MRLCYPVRYDVVCYVMHQLGALEAAEVVFLKKSRYYRQSGDETSFISSNQK